jgi:phage gp16-like protein
MADRASLIRLIHVARRDLALDDDAYRAIIQAQAGGKTSSADCTPEELDAIVSHFKRCGFHVKPAKKAQQSRPLANDQQSKKIRALWLVLHQVGKVRDPSESALAAFVKRMTGVEALQWLTGAQASRIIEHLKQWQDRVERTC